MIMWSELVRRHVDQLKFVMVRFNPSYSENLLTLAIGMKKSDRPY